MRFFHQQINAGCHITSLGEVRMYFGWSFSVILSFSCCSWTWQSCRSTDRGRLTAMTLTPCLVRSPQSPESCKDIFPLCLHDGLRRPHRSTLIAVIWMVSEQEIICSAACECNIQLRLFRPFRQSCSIFLKAASAHGWHRELVSGRRCWRSICTSMLLIKRQRLCSFIFKRMWKCSIYCMSDNNCVELNICLLARLFLCVVMLWTLVRDKFLLWRLQRPGPSGDSSLWRHLSHNVIITTGEPNLEPCGSNYPH